MAVIDSESTEPRAPTIPPITVYDRTLPALYRRAGLIESNLLLLSLFILCDSIIPPHIPMQCIEVRTPTMNRTKYVAPLSLEAMSIPPDEFPINIIAATIINIPAIL